MGIIMKLAKEDNILYTDFDNAYWSIEDVTFQSSEGVTYVTFSFKTYPSKAAKDKMLVPIEPTLSYGSSTGIAYNPLLHTFDASFKAADLFPDGIPITEAGQKDILYAFVKSYLSLTNYTDVLE